MGLGAYSFANRVSLSTNFHPKITAKFGIFAAKLTKIRRFSLNGGSGKFEHYYCDIHVVLT
jgi:hypothetical protein